MDIIFLFLALAIGLFAILIHFEYRKKERIPRTRPAFELHPEVQQLLKKYSFFYYFILTFSTEEDARLYWMHLTALRSPPSSLLALRGSWLSVDYGNVRRWFVSWLCGDPQDSKAISRWEVSNRRADTPAGVSYGSPSSPLSVGFQLEKIAETKEWAQIP